MALCARGAPKKWQGRSNHSGREEQAAGATRVAVGRRLVRPLHQLVRSLTVASPGWPGTSYPVRGGCLLRVFKAFTSYLSYKQIAAPSFLPLLSFAHLPVPPTAVSHSVCHASLSRRLIVFTHARQAKWLVPLSSVIGQSSAYHRPIRSDAIKSEERQGRVLIDSKTHTRY